MGNAHAEVVTQDQEPAGMWDLSREMVKGVSPDPATPVTTQTATNWPVWEIWAIPYAKAPATIFLEHSVHFLCDTAQPETKSALPLKKYCF